MKFRDSKPDKQRTRSNDPSMDGFPRMKSVKKEKEKNNGRKKWKSPDQENFNWSDNYEY